MRIRRGDDILHAAAITAVLIVLAAFCYGVETGLREWGDRGIQKIYEEEAKKP